MTVSEKQQTIAVAEKQQANEVLDKQLAFKAAQDTLSQEELAGWQTCKYTFRTLAHYDRIFILWEYVGKQATYLGYVRCLEPSVCEKQGFNLQLEVFIGGTLSEISVSHAPTPLVAEKSSATSPM